MESKTNGFDPDPEELRKELRYWFNMDHLEPAKGIAFLIGVVPTERNTDAIVNYQRTERANLLNRLAFGISLIDGDIISSNLRKDLPTKESQSFSVSVRDDEWMQKAESRFRPLVQRHRELMAYWCSGKHPEVTSPLYFVEWAKKKGFSPDWLPIAAKIGLVGGAIPDNALDEKSGSTHISKKLEILHLAFAKYWKLADRDDRGTHPDSPDVVQWLKEKGFSDRLAESGATIIRPEWAKTGRKAKE